MEKIVRFIKNLIYICIIIPLLYIALSVVWQSIVRPDQIPHIFGYKLFMILDENMENVEYGDLVFTKNIDENNIKKGDIIVFRDISENKVQITKFSEKENISNVEGILVKRIPKIGKILFFIQKPKVMLVIILIILTIGGICIYIAGKLDKKDIQKSAVEGNKV